MLESGTTECDGETIILRKDVLSILVFRKEISDWLL